MVALATVALLSAGAYALWSREAEAPVTLADLPGRLDAAGRVVLARRLVREGFLLAR